MIQLIKQPVTILSNQIRFKPRILPGAECKDIGGTWIARDKEWAFPLLYSSVYWLQTLYGDDLQFSTELTERLKYRWFFPELDFDKQIAPKLPEEMLKALLPHQKEAVTFLLSNPNKASLLGLRPGLGKTFSAIAAAEAMNAKQVLIVAPLSLLQNWRAERVMWAGKTMHVRHQKAPVRGWNVINYETLVGHLKEYSKVKWNVLIVDESILIKNKDAKRSTAVAKVARKAEFKWILSGSAIAKYYDDLYSQFRVLHPSAFKSYWRFARMHCHIAPTQWGDKVTSNRRLDMNTIYKDLMFIKGHGDVKMDFPQPIFERVHATLTTRQVQAYRSAVTDLIIELEENPDESIRITNTVSKLIRLQQINSNLSNLGEEWPNESGKLNALLDLVDGVEKPLVIWTHWVAGAQAIYQALRDKGYQGIHVYGDTKNKAQQIEEYKEGRYDFMIMSTQVGRFGHTLVNTKTMIYYDLTWDADSHIQSLARIVDRIGLKHQPLILTILTESTMDAYLQANLSDKALSITSVTRGNLANILRSIHSDLI